MDNVTVGIKPDVSSGDSNATATRDNNNILIDTFDRLDRFSLGYSLLLGLSVALAMLSISMNYVVISSLIRVPPKTLRSKVLVLSTLISNMVFPVVSSAEVIKFIIFAYGIRDAHTMTCWEFFGNSLAMLTQWSQSLSALALALDRAYAIVAPMTYHMIGYPTAITVIFLLCIWFAPWSIFTFYAIAQAFAPIKLPEGFCYKLRYGTHSVFKDFRFPLVIAFIMATFITYIGVFAALKLKRKTNKAVSSVQCDSQKRSMTLVVTFFMILLTTLAFYLPGPFFKLLFRPIQWRLSKVDTEIVLICLVMVYYLNTVIDPIIFATRIPSIRKRLPKLLPD